MVGASFLPCPRIWILESQERGRDEGKWILWQWHYGWPLSLSLGQMFFGWTNMVVCKFSETLNEQLSWPTMIRIHSDPDWCSPKTTQPCWSAVAVGSHGPWESPYVCLAKPLACSCPLPHLLTDHGTWFHSTTFHLGWPGSEVTVTTKSMSQDASCALLSLTTVLGRLFLCSRPWCW